ncbi:MAG: bifunctional methylenetetrahydrofolate dehydrogenase/methenyltetrahydrofolate cyclohydrolase FolD [Pelagibacteraceae bacterium]|nr:bifunctional methylenetetrahydrofolate dehydrogenase/methenyltetrahydrofolate cyclohydrolase FolD [Pelagibacteraceae bacterium]|tara:strand:- start:30653 stop:31540 length:888 start_codon:yes stop_codon:yes gene_type:complete
MTIVINGKEIAQNLKNNIKKQLDEIKIKIGKVPGLAVVQVGNDAASSVYVKAKSKSAKEVGIEIIDHHLPEETTQEKLLSLVKSLNIENNVSGILVQLPLPKHINEQIILDSINPEKDADGFHPLNVGKLSIADFNDENLLIPCTPYGCLIMIKNLGVKLSGKNAVVIGRSNIVGKPMAQLLLKESCTVTIVHSKTQNIEDICSKADIIVAAAGKPKMVKSNWIKKDAIVIDVGINRIDKKIEGSSKKILVGDVDFEHAKKKASVITPVPGGVGPMTIACLLRNTAIAFKNKELK